MNREEYKQVKQVFQSALDVAPAERAAFLDETCSGNADLRREVEKLLKSYDSQFLETPAIAGFAEAVVEDEKSENDLTEISSDNENRVAGKNLNRFERELPAGTTFSHYRIVSKIGAGGMGEVYLAEDTRLKRKIALKILPAGFSEDKARLRRFEQEAQAASALNHPNILTVHEFGAEGKTVFIASEFVKGETLRERLGGETPGLSEILDIALQIAAALCAAHESGIIHRDIKPENIMLREDGLVKVLDFGLAKLVENKNAGNAANSQINTTTGLVMGTPAYMSPEQARGLAVDARSDIWSLGVVLYEMLAGDTPFAGETTSDTIASILTREPAPLDENTPAELHRILRRALQKNLDERYQTAKDLLTDLKNAKRDLEFHDKSGRSTVPNKEANNTQSLPAAITDENRNQLNSSAGYFVTQVKKPKFIYLTTAVLLIAGIGFGIYRYGGSQTVNIPFESIKITKVTDSGKVGETVALSRDGKWLVYSIREGDKASVWLKQVAVPDSNTQIVPPAAVIYRGFAFSPDGNYLYYTIEEGTYNNCALYQMPVLGRTARKLLSGINGGINFSPDGKQITYGVEDLKNDESILMIANADGSEPRQLVKLKGNDEIGSSRGRFSPDGKSIAVFVGTNNPLTRELAAVSVATGEITRLETHKFREFGHWEWLPDGKSFVVFARDNLAHNNQFWLISYPSEEARKITNDTNVYSSMSLSADSTILATVQKSWTSNIWVVPVADTAPATQVTSGGGEPQWTPGGKLVYTRGFSDSQDIYIVDPRGGSPKRLTSNYINHSPAVSPDGRYIVYVSSQTGTQYIWRMDIDGGNPKQLTTQLSRNPSVSPNSQEIIYEVGVDTLRIWKVGIDGGQPVQLTDEESRKPVFSPDGKQFVCDWWDDSNSEFKFAVIPSEGGKPVKTYTLNAREFRWMPDGRSFTYIVGKDGVDNIWSQPTGGGRPKQLTNFTSEGIYFYDFSHDGKQIAVQRGTITSDVVLISGFKK